MAAGYNDYSFPLRARAMWFAIIATEHPDSLAARQAARPAHIARVKELLDQGRLLLGGPFPAIEAEDPGPAGFTGSLIVAEFPSLAEAERWAAEDPFVAAGVYANITVKPFRKTLP
ncbi:YciL protein [Aerosticca soli]|uniref:YciL protein n=2 Tax=Aerosticca soli TaxID=2010829 RepID=A0A2Z6E4J6_9GAMM|nr:YciL protein [Aerosticca soli]